MIGTRERARSGSTPTGREVERENVRGRRRRGKSATDPKNGVLKEIREEGEMRSKTGLRMTLTEKEKFGIGGVASRIVTADGNLAVAAMERVPMDTLGTVCLHFFVLSGIWGELVFILDAIDSLAHFASLTNV